MAAFLVGLQGGFPKFPCYLCHWDSRDTTAHYHRRICPKRTEYSVGYSNIKWDPFIDLIKILLPPLHINLGFIKQFVYQFIKQLTIIRQEFRRIQATTKLLYQDFCSKDRSWYFCWPTDKKDPRLQRIF